MKESNSTTTSSTPLSKQQQQSSLRTLAMSSLGIKMNSQDFQSTETEQLKKKDMMIPTKKKPNGNHTNMLQLKQPKKMEETVSNGNSSNSFHRKKDQPPPKQNHTIINQYKKSKLKLNNNDIVGNSDLNREKGNKKKQKTLKSVTKKSITELPNNNDDNDDNDDRIQEKPHEKDNEMSNHQELSMEMIDNSNSITKDCNQEIQKLHTSSNSNNNNNNDVSEKTTSKDNLILSHPSSSTSETESNNHQNKGNESNTIITGSNSNDNNNVSNDQDISSKKENQTATKGDDHSTGERIEEEETKDDSSESEASSSDLKEEEGLSQYELLRLRKIKRNQERMKQLGLFNLSMNMKKQPELPKMTTPTPKKAKRKTPMEVTPRTLPRRKARDNVMFPYGEDGSEQDMNTPHRGEKPPETDTISRPKPPKIFRMYTPMNQRLTRMFQKGGGKMRRFRCQRCASCQKPDCGSCTHCLDKRKFGGPDKIRQACMLRQKCEEWFVTEVIDADQGLGVYDNVLEALWGYGRIETCSVCHIGGDLLKCKECKQSIHLRCNVVADDSFIHLSRIGKWTCHQCTSRMQLKKKDETKDAIETKNKSIEILKTEISSNVETTNSKVSSTPTKNQPDTKNKNKETVEGSNIPQADKDTSTKKICTICNLEGASGTCGYCGNMFHDFCHVPSLSSMKPGKWKCMFCIAPSRKRRTRCGECPACCRPDCGVCTYCLDKPKFGGKSVKRKPCIERKCQKYNFAKMARLSYEALTTNQVISVPPHLQATTTPSLIKNENHTNSIDANDSKSPAPSTPKILTSKEDNISAEEEKASKETNDKKEEDKDNENENSNEIVKEDFPIEQEFYDDKNSDYCQICKKTGNLICCDKCPRSFHTKCLGVNEKDLPEDYWECRFCKDDVVAKSDEIMLGEKSFGEVNWAFSSLIEANHADLVYSKMLIVSKIFEMLDFLIKYDFGDIFASPVVNVPGYRRIISRPMDLGTIQKNIMKGVYYRNAIRSYSSEAKRAIFETAGDDNSSHGVLDVAILEILKDIETVWHNCFVFNLEDSVYFRMAQVQRRKHIALITSTFYDHLDSFVVNALTKFVNDCRLYEKMEFEEAQEEEKLEKEKKDSELIKAEILEKILKRTKRKKQKGKLSMPRKRHIIKTEKDTDELDDDKPLSKILKKMKSVTASEQKNGRKRGRKKSGPETPKKSRKRKLKDIELNEKGDSAGLSEEPKPKKRGRPRKADLNESVRKNHTKTCIEANEKGASAGSSEEPKPKKRGRPRKSDLNKSVTEKDTKPCIGANEKGASAELSEEPKPRKRGRPRKSDLNESVTGKDTRTCKSNSNELTEDKDSSDMKYAPKIEKVIINPEKINIIASSRKHILKTLTPNNILHNMTTKVIDVVLATVEAIDNNGEKPRTIIFNQDHFFNEYRKVRQIKKTIDKKNKKLQKKEGPVSRSRKGLKRKVTMKDTRVEDLVIISQKI